jgi:hypothetical protein
MKKPGFSDNLSIAAEILFRNPVSHAHAIARSRIKNDRMKPMQQLPYD